MTAVTGSDGIIAVKVQDAASFGTASACGAGDRIELKQLPQSLGVTTLQRNGIGSGRLMSSDAQVGAKSPTLTLDGEEGFNDALCASEAVFWGGSSVVTLGATGGYSHSWTMNETLNTKFLTVAKQFLVGSVMEWASCAPTEVNVQLGPVPDYGKIQIPLIANDRKTSGTVNTYSSLEATTFGDTELLVMDSDDSFRINLQTDGALSASHKLAIESASIKYMKPQDHSREIREVAGNGKPVPSGSPTFSAQLTIVLKRAEDITFFSGLEAGTEYKAQISCTGSQISGAVYRKSVRLFPRLKIVSDVDYQHTTPGYNPLTVTFECLVASSIPSGMFDRYPHVEKVSTKSTSYLA